MKRALNKTVFGRSSAILPLLKHSSTAAVRFPTSKDCLMRASEPLDQSVALFLELKPKASKTLNVTYLKIK